MAIEKKLIRQSSGDRPLCVYDCGMTEYRLMLDTQLGLVEKRIAGEIKNRMFYIPIETEFLNDDTENFNKQIQSYVASNKRDSILHKK